MKRILPALPVFILAACGASTPTDGDQVHADLLAACQRADAVIAVAEPWRSHPALSDEAKQRLETAIQTARAVCSIETSDLPPAERKLAVLTAISTIVATITLKEAGDGTN